MTEDEYMLLLLDAAREALAEALADIAAATAAMVKET